MKKLLYLLLLTTLSTVLYAQEEYKLFRTQLPFSNTEKDYYVKRIGTNYVLNGDIIVGSTLQRLAIYQSNNHDGAYIWPKGYVPVRIDKSMKSMKTRSGESMYQNAIDAINVINVNTNIRLTPYTNQKDYIRIMYTADTGYGGISPIGRRGGEQILYITRESDIGTVIHELLHSLGFWHEQSRYDRDQYVVIDTSNIKHEYRHNFQIEPGTPTSAYDYQSIMHYGAYSFAIDPKKPTIRCKNGNMVSDCTLGGSLLSNNDIKGINTAYFFNKDIPQKDYVAQLPYNDLQTEIAHLPKPPSVTDGMDKEVRAIDKPIEDGVYLIKVLISSKYLDITAVSMENGALLQQWEKVGWDNQKFAVTNLGNNLYMLKAMHSEKYLGVKDQSVEYRAMINQEDYTGEPNQKFYIRYEAAKKGHTIQGQQSEMYWAVMDLKNGDNIVQDTYIKDAYSFERVGDIPSALKPGEKIKTAVPVNKPKK